MREILVDINKVRGSYTHKGDTWDISSLVREAANLTPFEIPLKAIDMGYWPWGDDMNMWNLISHIERINDADLTKPIVMLSCGAICDGFHRIMKAHILKRKTILAVRFKKDPAPDRTKV